GREVLGFEAAEPGLKSRGDGKRFGEIHHPLRAGGADSLRLRSKSIVGAARDAEQRAIRAGQQLFGNGGAHAARRAGDDEQLPCHGESLSRMRRQREAQRSYEAANAHVRPTLASSRRIAVSAIARTVVSRAAPCAKASIRTACAI